MSNRRMALAAVVAVVVGLLVWWLSGSLRLSKSKTAAGDAGVAAAKAAPKVEQHGLWHTPRQPSDDSKADPEGDIRLEGQVIDAQQQPVGGATVVISSTPPKIVETEADGSFAVEGLLSRSYWVSAYKDGARADAKRIRARTDTEPVILRMYEGMTVVVTVLDRDTRAPIAGASVTTGQLLEQTAITDEHGEAELRGLPPSYNFAAVEADGYAPDDLRFELPEDPGGRFEQTAELSRGAAVSGIVLGGDGKGVGGTWVFGSGEHGGVRAETADDGTWTVPAVSAGAWVFSCPGEQWAPGESDPVTVDGETPVEGVEIRLHAGGRIAGVVVDSTGAPVPHAAVIAAPEGDAPGQVTSNADGTFEVLGLPRAQYLVVATEGDRASTRIAADVRTSDVSDLRVVIVDATISGVVVDAAGEPVAEAEVEARPAERSMYFFSDDTRTVTDSAGRWQIGPVSSESYYLAARWQDSAKTRYQGVGDTKPTEAKRGDRDVKIVLPAAATIRGVVVHGGAPVTRFAFTVGRRAARETPTIVSRADGKLERVGLPPGKYRVTIAGDGFATTTLDAFELAAGEVKDLGTIEVDAGRTVRGVVIDAGGAPVEGALVAVSSFFSYRDSGIGIEEDSMKRALNGVRSTTSGADGRFVVAGIADDHELKVVADKPGLGRSKQVQLPATDAELTLTIETTGTLLVTVEGGNDRTMVQAVGLDAQGDGTAWRDTGGVFRIEGLVPGTYEVHAMSMRPERTTPKVTVEVTGGETTKSTVAFPSGGVSVVIQTGEQCQYAMLMPSDETAREFVAASECKPHSEVVLEHIAPGDYRLCGGGDDCQPITVKPSPDRQTFTLK